MIRPSQEPEERGRGRSSDHGSALAHALDVSDDPVYIYDADGNCRWVNRAGERQLQLDARQIIGRSIFELFPGEARFQMPAWRRVTDAAEPSTFPAQITLDGEISEIQNNLSPVTDYQGRVHSVVSVGRPYVAQETSLLRAAQDYAKELEVIDEVARIVGSSLEPQEVYERFASEVRRLVEFDRLSVVLVDAESQTAERGYVVGQDVEGLERPGRWPVQGTGIGWVVERGATLAQSDLAAKGRPTFPEDAALSAAGLRSAITVPLLTKAGVSGTFSLWSRRPDAYGARSKRILERLAAQIAPAIENARLYRAVQDALETQRDTQEQLVRVERLKAMGELASGVAHDLNNALAAILGRTQLLMSQVSYEPHVRSLQLIEQASQDSANVVRRILDFARLESDVQFAPVDVEKLLSDVVELTRHKWSDEAQSKGQVVQVVIDAEDVPLVLGNFSELREVMTNLVINACEAMQEDGVVTLGARALGDRVQISVTDTGPGMSEEVRQRVFDPFFTTKGSAGTGLGLSVALGIITRHNGSMELDSREGAGTTVRMLLPRTDATATEEAREADSPAPARPARVLVVEDEALIRDTLADMLALGGHTVTPAADGREGVDVFAAGEFDIVFTDLGMPGLRGWEVAKAVKQLRPAVPVVMVTGWGAVVDPEDMARNGVDEVLAKPFDIDEVLDLVARLLDR